VEKQQNPQEKRKTTSSSQPLCRSRAEPQRIAFPWMCFFFPLVLRNSKEHEKTTERKETNKQKKHKTRIHEIHHLRISPSVSLFPPRTGLTDLLHSHFPTSSSFYCLLRSTFFVFLVFITCVFALGKRVDRNKRVEEEVPHTNIRNKGNNGQHNNSDVSGNTAACVLSNVSKEEKKPG